MPETLKLSNMGSLKKGDIVNIEQSMRMSDLLDGHVVLGHIDGKGEVLSIDKEGNSKVFKIKVPEKKFSKFLVYKGSVAIEGISLTITKVVKDFFEVKILPYTLEHTNLKHKKKGDKLNLEFDILAKYAHANKK
jgi:riboflavin synthase